MSFDLCAWFEPGPIAAPAAEQTYRRIADGTVSGVVDPGSRIRAFTADLLRLFPRLEDLGEDAIDDSPWSTSPDVSDTHVVMSLVWSQVKSALPAIGELAAKHDVVYYDPQAGTVHNSIHRHTTPALRLEMCDGSIVDDPDAPTLRSELERLTAANWYAVLEGRPQWYVQVGLGPDAGAPVDQYMIERRDGSADRHYQCVLTEREQVIAAFHGFAANDPGWTKVFGWAKVDF